MPSPVPRILFVCMGNICRSPTAHGVLRAQAQAAGLALEVDSAATHSYHVGQPPDPRSQQHARQRGIDLSDLRARALVPADFEHFDLVLVMDDANLAHAARLCPPHHRAKLKRFLDLDPQAPRRQVPDPYYGGAEGFEEVLDLVERASQALLQTLNARASAQSAAAPASPQRGKATGQ